MSVYSPVGVRELTAALTADVTVPGSGLVVAEATLVAAQSWFPQQWRRAAATGPVAAVGVQTAPSDRVLASGEWATIARRVAGSDAWRHVPWAAVRTSSHSMVVVAGCGQPPLPGDLQRLCTVLTA